jgi:hypothetical protein
MFAGGDHPYFDGSSAEIKNPTLTAAYRPRISGFIRA